jgi:hypothetical protein
MKSAKVVIVSLALAVTSGCATSSFVEQVNNSYAKAMDQSHMLIELYQDPENLTENDTLHVEGVVAAVNVVEVTDQQRTGTGIGEKLGMIGKVGGMLIDSGEEGKTITAKEYVFQSRKGETYRISQPAGEDYEQSLKEGDAVVFVSSKPLDQGGNTLFLKKL